MHQEIQEQEKELEIDIMRLLRNVWEIAKKAWMFVGIAVVLSVVLMLFIQQKEYTPEYKAYCTFSVHVVNKATLSDTNSLYAVYYDQDLAEQLDATFDYLINSDFLKDDIKEYLGTETIDGRVRANNIDKSNIFIINTYSSTPEKAGELLEALMAVYYDAARYVVGDMETEIIEGPVVSDAPHNVPSRTSGALKGASFALILSMLIIVLCALLKQTVFEPSDLEKHLNMQCFGVVPFLKDERMLLSDPTSAGNTAEQGMFRESIRGIAWKLERMLEKRKAKVILVTSTVPGEGKSTASKILAESFANWGKRVVLVDGDLRKPTLYRSFGFKREKMSLEDVLSGKAELDTVLRRVQNSMLTLVLNTMTVENPTVVAESGTMKELIATLSDQADVVIIDTPPCGQFVDASVYQQYADGILYVVQQDRVAIRQIVAAAESMNDSENKLFPAVTGTNNPFPGSQQSWPPVRKAHRKTKRRYQKTSLLIF